MAKKSGKADSESAGTHDGVKLVIVESPTKAKTIRKFLGKGYIVESCMGHIRDLPQSAKDIPEKVKKLPWAGLGVNVDNNFEPLYCIPKDKLKIVKLLKEKLEEASELYLATDEDREGESISWHLTEVLKPKVPVKRMVFHEITKDAIMKSLSQTRDIDFNLVKAQEARRILDRLVGYTISPLLWKKVAYGLSAGRVQSVAVRLIVEREHERIQFRRAQYSGVLAELVTEGPGFEARLQNWKGKKVATGQDFDGTTGKLKEGRDILILDEKIARELAANLKSKTWQVTDVEEKPTTRKPAAPFITSTLQQESNRKLGLGSRETMQVAQKLYEQGFITYMRTDSTSLSQEAIQAARTGIESKYGKDYLPPAPRVYDGKKAKGAQEAHEAIRPSGTEFVDPDATGLSGTQLRLYELIWKRTVASQMVDARQKQVSAKITVEDAIFSASGMTIEFPGFLRAYVEGSDDPDAELAEREVRLPALKKGDAVNCAELTATDHETKPPARYTEASLVQTMEKEGIGRPSTYASIIGTIIDRGYVRKGGTALIPTFTAMVVSKLLKNYLTQFVDINFTSQMERSLDTIAEGELVAEDYLAQIYKGDAGLKALCDSQEKIIDPTEARSIRIEGLEKFDFRVGKYGAYVCTDKDGTEFCASIPETESPADITAVAALKLIDQKISGTDAMGKDPKTGLPVYALNGRYGPYVQLGDVTDDEVKPKRVSLPPGVLLEDVTFELALELVALPKVLGLNPSLGKEIKAGLGRFGPFVVCEGDYRSIPKGESIFTITLERSLELFAQEKKGRGRAAPLREMGPHPEDGEPIQIMNGPYGPYFKWGKVNASLPEGSEPATVTIEQALPLLAERAGSQKGGGKKKSAGKSGAKSAGKSNAKSDSKLKSGTVVEATSTEASASKTGSKMTAKKAGGAAVGSESVAKPKKKKKMAPPPPPPAITKYQAPSVKSK